ncbi:MAG TPA: MFS transporter [Bryobacteraceae bacterium]
MTNRNVTWQMWTPCLTMAACSWLAFFHRQILSVLAPTILAETHLDAREFAGISSYFFVAYFIANPLRGSILDYIGLRIGMLIGVGVWSLASVPHGWMSTFLGFAAARVALGLGDGVTFPGGLGRRWSRFPRRAGLEVQQRLFRPFVSVGKKNGLGLGLATAHQTVIEHGGRMCLYSEPGWGACFTFSLPIESVSRHC